MCFYATLRFMTRHNMNDHWSCKTNWHYSAQTKIMNVEIVILWNCPKELFCKEIKESITTFAVATATMLDENHSNVSFVLVGEGSKLFLFNISLLNPAMSHLSVQYLILHQCFIWPISLFLSQYRVLFFIYST